jgi:predicted transcriptional regulator
MQEYGPMTDKQKVRDLVEAQPDDASYEEIVRELAFGRMVERGLADARDGRAISNEQMARRIESWRK